MPEPDDGPITPRLTSGFGLVAVGLGVMFLAGKALAAPSGVGIAAGIVLATAGCVLVITESLREPPR